MVSRCIFVRSVATPPVGTFDGLQRALTHAEQDTGEPGGTQRIGMRGMLVVRHTLP